MGTRAGLFVLLTAVIAAAAPPVEPAAPDLLYFTRHVAAEIHTRCAGCHSDPESAGGFLLVPLADPAAPDPATVLKNFRTALRFLDPADPGRSPLLRRALGDGHPGGGVYASAHAKEYEALLHFAMGATLDNGPPEAILGRRTETEVGRAVAIDGSLSGDPEGQELSYAWQLRERPEGSQAALAGEAASATLTPDRPGVYRVELRVGDGRLWSLPAAMLVVALEPAPAAATKPAAGRPDAPPEKPFTQRRLDSQRLRLIRRLYFDLKWRSPRLEELEAWYGRSHEEMVDAFLADEETWRAWYEQQLFYFLLLDQFRPKEGRLTTIPARLAKGEITLERALEEIVRSQYFNARNPGNDTFVTVVLEQCLGLVVQERKNKSVLESGKKMYDGYRTKLFRETGDSQADFVRIVFAQPDFRRHLLRRTWKELHGTEIDAKALEAEVEAARPLRETLAAWLNGKAYVEGAQAARMKPEIPYVRALFLDTLDRLPSYEELRNVRNAFLSLADPTPIRLVMGRVLLESDQARVPPSAIEAERFVGEQFLRLFARPPTERELTTFTHALTDEQSVTPRLVLWTLISSPEYQTY